MSSYGTSPNDVRLSIGNIGHTNKPNGSTRMSGMSTATTGGAGYAYYNSESGPKALLTGKGITRVLQFVLSLIGLATIASTNYGAYGDFSFLLAMNILTFIYSIVIIFAYLGRNRVDLIFPLMPAFELVCDGLLTVLVLAAAADASARCSSSCSNYRSSQRGAIEASIVFTWFLDITLIGATVLSYLENKQGEQVNKS